MKRWVLLAGVILLVAAAALFLWFRQKGSETPPPPPPIVSGETPEERAKNNPPPTNFAEFKDNNPELRAEMRDSLKKRFDEVIEIINKEPGSLTEWLDLGIIKHAFNDYKGAESAWQYALVLDPQNATAFGNLGHLYSRKIVDYPKAEAMFSAAINADTSERAVSYMRDLSDLYHYSYKEKADQADDVLLNGLRDFPEHRDLISYLARYYYETGDRNKAIEYFERLLKIDPSNQSAKDYLEELKSKSS